MRELNKTKTAQNIIVVDDTDVKQPHWGNLMKQDRLYQLQLQSNYSVSFVKLIKVKVSMPYIMTKEIFKITFNQTEPKTV